MLARSPRESNARSYGQYMVAVTRCKGASEGARYNWYSVIGTKMLLNFIVLDSGKRIEVKSAWGGPRNTNAQF